MQFLLVDASLQRDRNGNILQPERPSDANGTVINELGGGSTLSVFDPDVTDSATESRALPPYDIQFDPGALENVESVVFIISTTNEDFPDDLIVIDNYAPYAVSRAIDGFFEEVSILRAPGRLSITAQAYSRDIYEDATDPNLDLTPYDAFKKGEALELTDEPNNPDGTPGQQNAITISDVAGEQTEFSRTGQQREAEAEAETEVRAFAVGPVLTEREGPKGEIILYQEPAVAEGAVALAAAAAATGARALTQTLVSGSVSFDVGGQTPSVPDRLATVPAPPGTGGIDSPNPTANAVAKAAEGEAEVEIESEATTQASFQSAAAVAGTSVATAASGVTPYLRDDGTTVAVAAESLIAVDAASSTSTSATAPGGQSEPGPYLDASEPVADEPVSGEYEFAEPASEQVMVQRASFSETPREADSETAVDKAPPMPVLQLDTESEVEVEAEAEVSVRTATDAAAAAASGGAGVAVLGDLGSAAARTEAATSTVAGTLNGAYPAVFDYDRDRRRDRPTTVYEQSTQIEPVDAPAGPAPATRPQAQDAPIGSPVEQGTSPVSSNGVGAGFDRTGRGLFEAESEAEAEAEVAVDAGPASAAAACVATAGGGSTGIGASSRVAAATSASTSSDDQTGTLVRNNDLREVSSARDKELSPTFERNKAAEAEAEVSDSPTVERVFANGDARTLVSLAESGRLRGGDVPQNTTGIDPRVRTAPPTRGRLAFGANALVGDPDGNLEVEVEAEVEAETEAVAGYTTAAAGAAASAVRSGNGFVVAPSEAAAATSTKTSVLGGPTAFDDDLHMPGQARPGERAGVPDPGVDLSLVRFEQEMEAEAEAEVGYYAGAAAASAAGAGVKGSSVNGYASDRLVSTATEATPFAAAAAAAAGPATRTWCRLSDPSAEVGTAEVYAFAQDEDGGPVSIAIAVAGVPNVSFFETDDGSGGTLSIAYGIDNEYEFELSATGEQAKQGISLYYKLTYLRSNLSTSRYLQHADSDNPEVAEMDAPDSTFEDEAEVEAEAEAEAGYGVAAASAAAGSAGYYADAQTATATATEDVVFDYATIYTNRV